MAKVFAEFRIKDHNGNIKKLKHTLEDVNKDISREEIIRKLSVYVLRNFNTKEARHSFVDLDYYNIL